MKGESTKLTKKEQAAIEALQALDKIWPKTLLIGGNHETGSCRVWKAASFCTHVVVAETLISNMDAN